MEQISIETLMTQSGVGFGTSGARGLVAAMSDRVCYAYTAAFINYLQAKGEIEPGTEIALAGDFRSSTPRIMRAVGMAIRDGGYRPVNCGPIPSPAVALYGIAQRVPAVMVTGSHIPDDRNGIKFNKTGGEILKADEVEIRRQQLKLPAGRFDSRGMTIEAYRLPEENTAAHQQYVQRYLDFFPRNALRGYRIGLYEHSSVARAVMGEVFAGLGADLVRLGFSDSFIPVDTEAVRVEDIALARQWSNEYQLDCIVSTDGDGDRPLVSDEQGNWLRGDLAGILCARYLKARRVVTPISSNSAVEKCGWFEQVVRTRIGSPYVIAAMESALSRGERAVMGYEANGGFLQADDIDQDGRHLPALPTRDALIVPLAILMLAAESRCAISALVNRLPPRFTSSDRVRDFPTALSRSYMEQLNSGEFDRDRLAIEAIFGEYFGQVKALDDTDGVRVTFASDEVVHLRSSGNAPELRCYNEADSAARAVEMNRICMQILARRRE